MTEPAIGIGHRKWCVPDMYMSESKPGMTPSHESISFCRNGSRDAVVTITAVFEDDREPVVIHPVVIPPMKSVHFRMDHLQEWNVEIPRGIPYSVFIESSTNVVVEYARFNWIDGHVQSFGITPYFED